MKLKTVIIQYVALRQAMGEHGKSAERVLNTFCRSVGPEIEIQEVEADQVNVFLAGTGPITRYWHRKHGVLRGGTHLSRDSL